MFSALKSSLTVAAAALWFAGACFAQTATIEGNVKDEKGEPVRDAQILIERKDVKGRPYKTKTDRKGHYLHIGLPLGDYRVILELNGQVRDQVDNVRTRLGDAVVVDFDMKQQAARQEQQLKAIQSGQMTTEQARDLTPQQKQQMEKEIKDRQAQMAKNKELNDAFNQGVEAVKVKQYDVAVAAFEKAGAINPNEHVIWGQLADAYVSLGLQKPAEQQAILEKAFASYQKAIAIKPDDATYRNNYGLALARGKKISEAEVELQKAAELDPAGAGKYFYNLGAVLTNTGQSDASVEAFKKAIAADPNYADAYYQYGIALIGKATTTPEGKIVPPPGTTEAFEKYLSLRPDGPYAGDAKAMLATIGSTLETTYQNPAKKNTTKKK